MEKILSAIIFTPLLGAIVAICFPNKNKTSIPYIALFTTCLTFILSCLVLFRFDPHVQGIQFLENHHWISTFNISYLLGVDGLSVFLIPLTTLIFLLGVIASWNQKVGMKGYFGLLLMLETAVLGTFMAQDLFLFLMFWEAALLPVYFMVEVWGNKRSEYAATKFFLYQLAGSAFLLLGILAIYYAVEPHQFSILELNSNLAGQLNEARLTIGDKSFRLNHFIFIILLLGFAVRFPVVPLHSWFPHIASEAPAVLTVIVAAVFIKTAGYAILRINYALFPDSATLYSSFLAIAGVINIIYGGLCAVAQKDIRKLAAYACISHMGFILLGMGIFSSSSLHGALLSMFSQGIYIALIFFLIGILGSRNNEYNFDDREHSLGYGGLVKSAPIMTGFFTVAVFSALGVPGLGAFPAESLVFLGAFPFHRLLTGLGLFGVFLTAGYMLWMFKKIFLGDLTDGSRKIDDVSLREQIYLIPLVLLCIFSGSYPAPLINMAQLTIDHVLMVLGHK